MILNIMVKSTKKQTSLALVAIVLATAMIVGTLAVSADNSAFAKKKVIRQSISQDSTTAQTTSCVTPGGSGATTGGVGGAIAAGACTNTATNSPFNAGSNTFTFTP
jgi:hypothetical protein